jgi:hypothetical protein
MNISKRPRRNHFPLFKAKVAIDDAIKHDKTYRPLQGPSRREEAAATHRRAS